MMNPSILRFRQFSDTVILSKSVYPYDSETEKTYASDQQINITLAPDEDAVISIPDPMIIRGLQFNGGRHIRFRKIILKAIAAADQSTKALLRFSGPSGSVTGRGLHLDCNNEYGLDALLIGGVAHNDFVADYDFNTILIENTHSTKEGLHADGVQFYGKAKSLRIENATIRGSYQGLFLDPQHDIGEIYLKDVDISYTDPENGNGYAFYLRQYPNGRRPLVRLENVWVDERSNYPGQHIYPPSKLTYGYVEKYGKAFFPYFPEVEGFVNNGRPPGGSFVHEDCI